MYQNSHNSLLNYENHGLPGSPTNHAPVFLNTDRGIAIRHFQTAFHIHPQAYCKLDIYRECQRIVLRIDYSTCHGMRKGWRFSINMTSERRRRRAATHRPPPITSTRTWRSCAVGIGPRWWPAASRCPERRERRHVATWRTPR